MAKDLLFPGNILSLHRKAAEKLMKEGNGDAALLYLCLAAGRDSRRPCPGAPSGWRTPKTPWCKWVSSTPTPPSSPSAR